MAEQNENLSNRSFELCRRVVTTESFIAEAKDSLTTEISSNSSSLKMLLM